jgi:hypothetical protein
MSRRGFLKTLTAAAAVSFVPEIGFAIPHSLEPTIWNVQYENYDTALGVGATWIRGKEKIRRAVNIDWIVNKDKKESVELCKQALRQWYVESGQYKWGKLDG